MVIFLGVILILTVGSPSVKVGICQYEGSTSFIMQIIGVKK